MPILHRDRVAGRLDPKAHRAHGHFEVCGVHLEPGVPLSDELVDGLAGAIAGCARWHGTPQVTVLRPVPPALAEALQARCLALI